MWRLQSEERHVPGGEKAKFISIQALIFLIPALKMINL